MKRTLVIGGGLAGLACAHELQRRGRDVLVLERRPRAGGVVGTLEVDGFRFETGPHTLLPSARAFRTLADELGLTERLIASSPDAKRRYLWFRGKLEPLPAGPLAFFGTPLLSLGAKLHLLSEPFRRRPPDDPEAPEPTLAAFLEERLGPEPTRRFAGAFVRGVYAGDIERLGAASAFPKLWELAQHGGLFRGFRARGKAQRADPPPPLPGPEIPRGRLVSFPGGLAELAGALERSLGDALRTGAPVEAVEVGESNGDASGGRWRARLADGEVVAGDELVLAVPAPIAARLLEPLGLPAGELDALRTIEHAHVRVVHLGLDPGERAVPSGFGYLVPPDASPAEGAPRVLGTIFASNLFPGRAPEGAFAVACFYRWSDTPADAEETIALAGKELAASLGWNSPPDPRVARVIDWKDVIPQYAPGHAARLTRLHRTLDARLPGLRLAGSYVGGVSVDDVLRTGRAVGARCAERAEAVSA